MSFYHKNFSWGQSAGRVFGIKSCPAWLSYLIPSVHCARPRMKDPQWSQKPWNRTRNRLDRLTVDATPPRLEPQAVSRQEGGALLVCVLIPSTSPFTSLHSLSPDSASLSPPEISRKKQKTSSVAQQPVCTPPTQAHARSSCEPNIRAPPFLANSQSAGAAQHSTTTSSCSARPPISLRHPHRKCPPRGLAPPTLDH